VPAKLCVSGQRLLLLQERGQLRLLISDAISATGFVCCARKGRSLLYQLAKVILNHGIERRHQINQ
jgi:hypothetical protein